MKIAALLAVVSGGDHSKATLKLAGEIAKEFGAALDIQALKLVVGKKW